MGSLKGRLLFTSLTVLLAFVCLTGLGLERAFDISARQAQEDKMKGLVYALLGATEVGDAGSVTVDTSSFLEERLRRPNSGLTAAILDRAGRVLWQSPSLLGTPSAPSRPLDAGEWAFGTTGPPGRDTDFQLAFGVDWASDSGAARFLTVTTTEDTTAFNSQLSTFRRSLWGWLLVAVACLLVVQVTVLRWGLSPLQRVASELHEIRAGHKDGIGEEYPKELYLLTEGLNSLLQHERGQQIRYRHALDDLAHSLKTPLTVLRALTDHETIPEETQSQAVEQVGRIEQILDYQIRKAATVGRQAFTHPLPVKPLVAKIVEALSKVYREKQVTYQIDMDSRAQLRGDEGDLMELLGNLLDNASKWCRRRVRIAATSPEYGVVDVIVDDDGPGFPPDQVHELLQRGVRADSRTPGEGIGLAVVQELVTVYGGTMDLCTSPLGGARVHVTLPQ